MLVARPHVRRRRVAVVLDELPLVRALGRKGHPVLFVTPDADAPGLRSRYASLRLIVAPWRPPTEAHAVAALCRAGAALARRFNEEPWLVESDGASPSVVTRHHERLARYFTCVLASSVLGEDPRWTAGPRLAWDDPVPDLVGFEGALRRRARARRAWA